MIITQDPYGNIFYSNSDEIILFENDSVKSNHTVYSDRLYQWDWEKYNSIRKKIFNDESQYFDGLNPKDIERFLIEYLGKELVLVRVQKYINKSNGFPYWRFDYSTNDETHTE